MMPTTMQVMTMSRKGLHRACLFSGGGVGEDAMGGWMQDLRACDFFGQGGEYFWSGFRKHVMVGAWQTL